MKTFASLVGIGMALALGAAPRPALAQAASPTPGVTQPSGGSAAPAPGRCAWDGWLKGPAAARLGLTAAQRTSWQAIVEKHRASLDQKRQAAFDARQAYWEAAGKPDTAPDTLRQLHRTLSDQAFEAQLERRALRQELHAVLTPEQRERAARMQGRMEGRMQGRMAARMGACGGPGYGPGPGNGCAPMGRVRRQVPPAAPAQ
jgi:Spy/CpxP family protein refolding chaperone